MKQAKATKRRRTKKATNKIPQEWPAANAEERATVKLVPYARNAKVHSQDQVRRIAASIREWGWTMPVLVDESNGIIAGHGRVLAAELLEIEHVPVMVARGWSDPQKRAYLIADNKLTEAPWDNELLALELRDLQDLDFDLDLTGFDENEVQGLLFGDDALRADAVPVPPRQKDAVSQLGDRWQLGEHIIYCGDAREEDSWLGVEGSMLWTDPPYGVAYVGKTADALEIENDGLTGDALETLLAAAFALAVKACRPGSVWYVASPAGPNFLPFAKVLTELGIWRQTLVWAKDVFVLGRSDFHYKHETLFYGWKPGSAHRFYGDRKNDTIWEVPRPKRSPDHPTMKPLALIAKSLEFSSLVGDTILDPFAGSGSTLIACEATNRICFAIEIDPLYVDVAIRRWEQHTGLVATLDGDGRTFAAIESEGR